MRATRTSGLTECSSRDENSHPNKSQSSKGALSAKRKDLSSGAVKKTSPKNNSAKWSEDETCKLMELFGVYKKDDTSNEYIWDLISKEIQRTPGACRNKMRKLKLCGKMKTGSPGVSVESIASDRTNDASSDNSSEKQQVHELVETEKAVASSPLKPEAQKDESSSESSTSDDWSEDETIQLMRVLASIDQGVFDEIPRCTHDIWKKVSGKMGSRSPTACHKQMDKMGLEFIHKVHSTSCESSRTNRMFWTKERSKQLEELYQKYFHLQEEAGKKAMWQAISKELGKSVASCKSRYRAMKRTEQKHQTASEETISNTKELETTPSVEENDPIDCAKKSKSRWTKEEERILLEFSDANAMRNHDFSIVAERLGRTPYACKSKIYDINSGSRKPKMVSTKVKCVEMNTKEVTIPREIPEISIIEKISPLSASTHTNDDINATKETTIAFDTPTKELIDHVFDDDENGTVDGANALTPKGSYHNTMPMYSYPFTPRSKTSNAIFQMTWTPLDKSAPVDYSEILEWDSLEISSNCESMCSHEKMNEIDDPGDVPYESNCDQDFALNRTPIVARTKRKFETYSVDDFRHPRSDPCHLTKFAVYSNCPNSVSVHSDPCCYGRNDHNEFAELNQLIMDVETPLYQPKKRSICENKPHEHFHEEINLNIEADDYFDLGDMEYLTLDEFFQ